MPSASANTFATACAPAARLEAADEPLDHVDGGAHVGADLVHVDRRLTGPIGGASRAEPAASSRATPS